MQCVSGGGMADELVHVLTVVDGESEELLDLVELRRFDLVRFREQFDVDAARDPEMRDRYAVGPDDATFLNEVVGYQIPFDFRRYAYFIEAARKGR